MEYVDVVGLCSHCFEGGLYIYSTRKEEWPTLAWFSIRTDIYYDTSRGVPSMYEFILRVVLTCRVTE